MKGVSGDVIILEEAAYCDPGLVSEVVVPLLSMQQSVLLCISTILDSGNHYSKMMELVDDYGHTVFETIKITLVCGAPDGARSLHRQRALSARARAHVRARAQMTV